MANVSIYPDWSIRELSAKSPSIQFRPDAIDQRESQSDPTSYAAKEYDVMTLKKRLAICLPSRRYTGFNDPKDRYLYSR